MLPTRPPAVAGSFYPGDPDTLRASVDAMLADVRAPRGPRPKALIVPHAGHIYSGPVAAHAYATLVGSPVTRVVLVGPAHRVAVRGLVSSGASGFDTPLGRMRLDTAALSRVPEVVANERAHAMEHSLEVQVPFLQRVLPDAGLVPLVVGHARPEEVAEVLDALWGGDETAILISSDLSHYLAYDAARAVDANTLDHVLALDADAMSPERACGYAGVAGLLVAARRHGLVPRVLDARNSGDTAGDRGRVVGYASVGFYREDHRALA
jgi:AmmeMemoRadiSam system protein B